VSSRRELPQGWERIDFGDFVELQNGFAFKKTDFQESGIPVVRQTNLEIDGIDSGKLQRVPEDFLEKYSSFRLEHGDMLIGMSGSIGKISRYTLHEPGLLNQRVGKILIPASLAKAESFTWFFLQTVKELLQKKGKGIAVLNVSANDIKSLPYMLPPLNEQKRIADKLERSFAESAQAKAALEEVGPLLESLRKSILHRAFTGQLTADWRAKNPDVEPAEKLLERIKAERRKRWEEAELAKMTAKGKPPKDDKWKAKYKEPTPPDTTNLPELPNGWCWASLDEISDLKGGITKGTKLKTPQQLETIPYLRVANVQRGYLDLSEVTEIEAPVQKVRELLLQDGDLLFNEGGDIDKLGRGWVWKGQIKRCIHQNHVFRGRLFTQKLIPELVSTYTNEWGQPFFIKHGKQTTNLASVSLTTLKQFPVPLIPVEEQEPLFESLNTQFEHLGTILGCVETNNTQLSTLNQSILHQAFTGQLVPQDPNDEPASELLKRIQTEREAQAAKPKTKTPRKASAKKKAPKRSKPQKEAAQAESLEANHAGAVGRANASEKPDLILHSIETHPLLSWLKNIFTPEGVTPIPIGWEEMKDIHLRFKQFVAENPFQLTYFELTEPYKVLQAGFSVKFSSKPLIAVLGSNGAGKSTLFELIAQLFAYLKDPKKSKQPSVSCKLHYSNVGTTVHVEFSRQRQKNPLQISAFSELFDPDELNELEGLQLLEQLKGARLLPHVMAYYSGQNDRLQGICKPLMELERDYWLDFNPQELPPNEVAKEREELMRLPPVFQLLEKDKLPVILALFYLPPEGPTRIKLQRELKLWGLAGIKLTVTRKWKSKQNGKENSWGMRGLAREFCEKLYAAADEKERAKDLQDGFEVCFESEAEWRGFDYSMSPLEVFQMLWGLSNSNLDVKIDATFFIGNSKNTARAVPLEDLSEGESQLLNVLGLLAIATDQPTLYLLDEPDTNLNPAWRYKFSDIFKELRNEALFKDRAPQIQTLLATHDPVLIAGLEREEVLIMERKEKGVRAYNPYYSPKGMGVAGILSSEMFKTSSLDRETQKLLDTRAYLIDHLPLTDPQISQLTEINQKLSSMGFRARFPVEDTPRFQKAKRALIESGLLNSNINESELVQLIRDINVADDEIN